MLSPAKPRVLVFIVAYDAETTISQVLRRIPASLSDDYSIEILIIDDASHDVTFEQSHRVRQEIPFPVQILSNPTNQGYGGNQKLGYHYAIERDYDFVALVHGDGQYAPECLPSLLQPLRIGEADAVFGSRMMTRLGALRGGMPLYKYVGNRILTWIENTLLDASLSEFHSGYRLYSVDALRRIPFHRNSNDFDFDTEIIIQLLTARLRIKELEIPTYYGDEISRVNGLKYARKVVIAAMRARLQKLSLFYDPKYDCAPGSDSFQYSMKLDFLSPHTLAIEYVKPNSRVLDLGCAGGYMGSVLKQRKTCHVVGIDAVPVADADLDEFYVCDLNAGVPAVVSSGRYDSVLLLDVVEHLRRPDAFLEELQRIMALTPATEVLISTGNVAFVVTRLMLFLGQFNYGRRGILDQTHTKLYTFSSLRRTLEQAGYVVRETRGIPAPFPLAVGAGALSRFLLAMNGLLIKLAPGLFSYQIFMRVQARPSLQRLLADAQEHSRMRESQMHRSGC